MPIGTQGSQPQDLSPYPFFSQYPLDRKAVWRRNTNLLAELCSHQQAKLLPFFDDLCLVLAPGPGTAYQPFHPAFLTPARDFMALCSSGPDPSDHVFLGVDQSGAPFFAARVTGDPRAFSNALPFAALWKKTRVASTCMGAGDAALVAVASGLLTWHADNKYHGATGAATWTAAGGYSRKCTQSGQTLYVLSALSCTPDLPASTAWQPE